MPLLSVRDLRTYFHTREGVVRAVDGISYDLEKGETLGIVGESGSGKSVSCYSLLGLIPTPPGKLEGGQALFDGVDLLQCSSREYRAIRGKRISMIFQDPMTALNPYMTIGRQLMEPLRVHTNVSRDEAKSRAVEMLDNVGITDAERRLDEFPHQFSGGMRQRVMIAMALITRPEIVIADEPTTALDVTVQAQILALIKRLQAELGMAMILITHDMGVIAGTCDYVLVMYAGRVVEEGTNRDVFKRPKHPYTKALLDSMPAVAGKGQALYTISGMPPDLTEPIVGCSFAPRCVYDTDPCWKGKRTLETVEDGHATRCLRIQHGEIAL